MKLKIVSDGTAPGTKLVDAVTGEAVDNVIDIIWTVSAVDMISKAIVHMLAVPIDVTVDADVKPRKE